jgi:hypothetical protein
MTPTKPTALSVGMVLASVVLAALRVVGYKSPAYQALAHLLVGGMFVAGWHGRLLYLGLAVLLSLVELVVFVLDRFSP